MKRAMNNDVRLPEVEVRVTVGTWDVFVLALYASKDIHAPFEGVAAISKEANRQALVQVLADAIAFVKSDGWLDVDQLDTRPAENEERPPF